MLKERFLQKQNEELLEETYSDDDDDDDEEDGSGEITFVLMVTKLFL